MCLTQQGELDVIPVMRKFLRLVTAIVLCLGVRAVIRQESPAGQGVTTEQSQQVKPSARYIEKEFFIPVLNAMPQGLDVLELYIATPGGHPLAVLTHGSSVDTAEHAHVTPWAQMNQAIWFALRGYVVLVVVRKGYGKSGGQSDGTYGGCGSRGSFEEAGEASATDLREVINWASKQPEVDPETVLSVGISTGGFAQVALSANPPRALKAAISFAGGRGSDGKEHNCNMDGLLRAFHGFGKDAAKHGSVPMLWIYSQNDHYFPAAMATKFDEAYRKGGGADEFVMAPPNGDDGHHLYSHPDVWSDTVSAFLKSHGLLPLGDVILPLPAVPDTPAPEGLHDRGLEAWKRFLAGAPWKAFATTGDGVWGQSLGVFNQEMADREAMERCRKAATSNANACHIVARTPGVK
jgi:dienelactone hydrolase